MTPKFYLGISFSARGPKMEMFSRDEAPTNAKEAGYTFVSDGYALREDAEAAKTLYAMLLHVRV